MKKNIRSILSLVLAIVMLASSSNFYPVYAMEADAQDAPIQTDTGGLLDTIHFGDSQSEEEHDFLGAQTESIIGEEGESARVSLPLDPAAYFGGDITFKLTVDPDKQNYFTIKLWGSDPSTYFAHTYVERERLGYQGQGDVQAINKTETPSYENRFVYSTQPIPMKFTQGRTQVELTIKTVGAHWNYGMGTAARLYKEKVTGKSKAYYAAYSHTQASLPETLLNGDDSGGLEWQVKKGTDMDPGSKAARNWLTGQRDDINDFVSKYLTQQNILMTSSGSDEIMKLANYLKRDFNDFTAEIDGVKYDYTPDILLSNALRDEVLDRIRLGLDQLILYYLSEPNATIGHGGTHAEWGSFMKQAGEAIWTVYQLFEGQAKLSEKDGYESVERHLITDPVSGNRYGNKDNLSKEERYEKYTGLFGAMYLTREECEALRVPYREGKYKSFDDWLKGDAIIDWSDTNQVPSNKTNPFASGTAKVTLNVIQEPDGGFRMFDEGQYVHTDENGKLTYAAKEDNSFTANNKTTRFDAMQDMFYVLNCYNRVHERGITNQTFYSAFGTFNTNQGLLAMGSELAENYVSSLRFLYGACGVDYWLGNDIVDGNVKIGTGRSLDIKNLSCFEEGFDEERSYIGEKEAPKGEQYHMVSPDGLTKEPSYVAGYGQATDDIVHVWKTTYDDELLKMALKAHNARSYMCYQDVADSERVMRIEGVVESRGPAHPGYIGYPGRADRENSLLFTCFEQYFNGNEEEYAGSEWDLYKTYAKNAVGYAQHQLMDNYYLAMTKPSQLSSVGDYLYTADEQNYKGILMPMAYNSSLTNKEAAKIEKMNPGYLENRGTEVFTDIEDAIVAVRDGESVFFIEFFFIASYGLNGFAKVHALMPEVDVTATVTADVQYTPSGYWNTRSDFTVQDNVYDPATWPEDGAIMALRGQIMPIAASVNNGEGFDGYDITPVKTGSPFSGYGDCYSMQYGKYYVALNTTTNSAYQVTLPSGYHAATVKDIVTGENLTVSEDRTVTVPPSTALVLDMESHNLENNTPGPSIFVTGTGTNRCASISWEPASGTSEYYEIYRADSSDGEYICVGTTADAHQTVYMDETVLPGQTYYYKVCGYASEGSQLIKGAMSVYCKTDIPAAVLGNGWISTDVKTPSGLTAVLGEDETAVRFTGVPSTDPASVSLAKDKTDVIDGKEVLPNYAFAYQSSIVPTNPELLLSSNGLMDGVTVQKGESAAVTAEILENYETISSDFTFKTKVSSDNPVGYTGIMVKELRNQKVAENARGIIFTIDNAGEYRISYRQWPDVVDYVDYLGDGYDLYNNYNPDPITGSAASRSEDGSYYLKLVRHGAYYNAYVSADGWNYELAAEDFWVPMAETVVVGAASAGEASFSEITLNDGYESINKPLVPELEYREYAEGAELFWKTVTNGKTYTLYRSYGDVAAPYPVVSYQEENGYQKAVLNPECGWEQLTEEGFAGTHYRDDNIITGQTLRYVLAAANMDGYSSSFSNVVTFYGVGSFDGLHGRTSLEPVWDLAEWGTERNGFAYLDMENSAIRLYGQSMSKANGNAASFLYQEVDADQDFALISRINGNSQGTHKIPLWGARGIAVRNGLDEKSAMIGAVSQRLDYTSAWIRPAAGKGITKGSYDDNGQVGIQYHNDDDYWKKIVKTGNSYQVFYAPVTGEEKAYSDITGWKALGYYSGTQFIDTFELTDTQETLYAGTMLQTYNDYSYLDTLYAVPLFRIPEDGTVYRITQGMEQQLQISATDAFGNVEIAASDMGYSIVSDTDADLDTTAVFDSNTGVFKLLDTAPVGSYTIDFTAEDPSGANILKGGIRFHIEVCTNAETNPILAPLGDRTMLAGGDLSFLVKAEKPGCEYSFVIRDEAGNMIPEDMIKGTQITLDKNSGLFIWKTDSSVTSQTYYITFTAVSADGEQDEVVMKLTVKGVPRMTIAGLEEYEYIQEDENTYTVTMKALEQFEASVTVENGGDGYITRYEIEKPGGAQFEPATGKIIWTPSYQQYLDGTEGRQSVIRLGAYNAGSRTPYVTIKFLLEAPDDVPIVFAYNWTPVVSSDQFSKDASTYVSYQNDAKTSFILDTGNTNGGNLIFGRSLRVAQPVFDDAVITVRVPGEVSTIRHAVVMFGDSTSMEQCKGGNWNEEGAFMFLAQTAALYSGKPAMGFGYQISGVGDIHRDKLYPLLDAEGNPDHSVTGSIYLRAKYDLQEDGSAVITGSYSQDGITFMEQPEWNYTMDRETVEGGVYVQVMGVGQPTGSGTAYPVTFDQVQLETGEGRVSAYAGSPVSVEAKAVHPYREVTYDYSLTGPDGEAAEGEFDQGVCTFVPKIAGDYVLNVTAAAVGREEETIAKSCVIQVKTVREPVFNHMVPALDAIAGLEINQDVSAVQADGDAITYSVSVKDPEGNLCETGEPYVSRTGIFSWTPPEGAAGIYTVEVTAAANGPAAAGKTAVQTFMVEVKPARTEFINEWQPVVSYDRFTEPAENYVIFNDGANTSITLDARNTNSGTLIFGRSVRAVQPVYGDAVLTAKVKGDGSTIKHAILMFGDSKSIEKAVGGNWDEQGAYMYFAQFSVLNSGKPTVGFASQAAGKGDMQADKLGTFVNDIQGNVYLRAEYKLNPDGSALVNGYYSVDGIHYQREADWSYPLSRELVEKGIYAVMIGVGHKTEKGTSYPVTFENVALEQEYTQVNAVSMQEAVVEAKAYHPFKVLNYQCKFLAYTDPQGNSRPEVLEKDAKTAVYEDGIFRFVPSAAGSYLVEFTAASVDGQSTAVKKYRIETSQSRKLLKAVSGNDRVVLEAVSGNEGYWAETVSGNESYTAETVFGNENYWEETVSGNEGYQEETVFGNESYTAETVFGNEGYAAETVFGNEGYAAETVFGNEGYAAETVSGNEGYAAKTVSGNGDLLLPVIEPVEEQEEPQDNWAGVIQWSVSDSEILSYEQISDSQIRVTGIKTGTAYVYAVYNDRVYSYRIAVTEEPGLEQPEEPVNPEKPVNPMDPDDSDNPSALEKEDGMPEKITAPQTGDNNGLLGGVMVLASSILAVALILVRQRKRDTGSGEVKN